MASIFRTVFLIYFYTQKRYIPGFRLFSKRDTFQSIWISIKDLWTSKWMFCQYFLILQQCLPWWLWLSFCPIATDVASWSGPILLEHRTGISLQDPICVCTLIPLSMQGKSKLHTETTKKLSLPKMTLSCYKVIVQWVIGENFLSLPSFAVTGFDT